MLFYPEDYTVEVIVPFTDKNGAPITLTAFRAALYDGDGELLIDYGNLPFTQLDGQKTVTVLAALNQLATENTLREARVLRVEMDTAAGTVRKSLSYVIEAEQTVKVMVNSFQGYESAEIQALDFVNLTAWLASDETRRRAALVEAYRRLIQIPMKYLPVDINQNTLSGIETTISRSDWIEMTLVEFNELPDHFRRALRTAQVLEANEILSGDSISRKHRAGIITETIGESSVTLNKASADYGLSRPALAVLVGYLDNRITIARA
jgi:hypothetical protein